MINNVVDLHIRNRWQSLRIRELEARNNVLDDAVELWRQRAGEQRAADDETLL